jgi:hypothetical protein
MRTPQAVAIGHRRQGAGVSGRWLVLVLPLALLPAGIGLVKSLSAPALVATDVTSLEANAAARAEQRAGLHGLSAELEITEGSLRLELSGRLQRRPKALRLRFVSPDGAGDEFEIVMRSTGAGDYRAAWPRPIENAAAWQVAVEPPDGHWRLWGRFEPRPRIVLQHAT